MTAIGRCARCGFLHADDPSVCSRRSRAESSAERALRRAMERGMCPVPDNADVMLEQTGMVVELETGSSAGGVPVLEPWCPIWAASIAESRHVPRVVRMGLLTRLGEDPAELKRALAHGLGKTIAEAAHAYECTRIARAELKRQRGKVAPAAEAEAIEERAERDDEHASEATLGDA